MQKKRPPGLVGCPAFAPRNPLFGPATGEKKRAGPEWRRTNRRKGRGAGTVPVGLVPDQDRAPGTRRYLALSGVIDNPSFPKSSQIFPSFREIPRGRLLPRANGIIPRRGPAGPDGGSSARRRDVRCPAVPVPRAPRPLARAARSQASHRGPCRAGKGLRLVQGSPEQVPPGAGFPPLPAAVGPPDPQGADQEWPAGAYIVLQTCLIISDERTLITFKTQSFKSG